MAASATVVISAGADSSPAANKAMPYYVTITNTGANPLTLNAMSVSSPTPGVIIAQPDFLTPNVPYGVGNPVIAAGASLAVRFSAVFPMPNASGPSPQGPTGATNAVNQPAFPVNGYFNLQVTCQLTDSAGVIVEQTGNFGQGVLSEMQNVPRAEGGALDFRQGSNILGMVPGWP